MWRQSDINCFLYPGHRDERPSGDLNTTPRDGLRFSLHQSLELPGNLPGKVQLQLSQLYYHYHISSTPSRNSAMLTALLLWFWFPYRLQPLHQESSPDSRLKLQIISWLSLSSICFVSPPILLFFGDSVGNRSVAGCWRPTKMSMRALRALSGQYLCNKCCIDDNSDEPMGSGYFCWHSPVRVQWLWIKKYTR